MSTEHAQSAPSTSLSQEARAAALSLGLHEPAVAVAPVGPLRLWRNPRRPLGALGVRLLAAICCGLLMWLAFPPHDLWWAAAVGSAGLTLVLRGTT